jgi:hypothetical protein
MKKLFADVKKEAPRLRKESTYPLAPMPGARAKKPAAKARKG